MSYLDDAKRLERDAEKMLSQARIARQKQQDECAHPYSALSFSYGATTSYDADITLHSMTVKCSLCEGTMSNQLKEYKDY